MRRYARWLLIAMLAVIAGQPARVRTQATAPPILLITNSAAPNPFGPYLAEILRAEGLNQFATKDLSAVSASDLTDPQLVVLAETPLTPTQANMFSNYVAGGGRLVAMRPDDQLAPVLGLTPSGSSTSEGYFAINTAIAFADGFPAVTLPFHGQANNYTAVNGSTVLATLYSNAVTATVFPAVIKSGRTATWSYDLARSVVYTRQGNPANASERDGQLPYRTQDLFYNAIDLDKVNIPYADVQMRMLGRVISDLLADAMPLPRLWYFPGSNRTLMVVTSDSHGNPQSYFDAVASSVEARGGRVSFYIFGGTDPSSAQVAAWRAIGHEVGLHPSAAQYGRSMEAAFQAAQDYFTAVNDGAPSATTRIHQLEWQGWVDAAKIEAAHGIGLDTSFYTQGPAVFYPEGSSHQAHGYINGSGLPMRFIDEAGAMVPVYQQVTSIIDHQLAFDTESEKLSPSQAFAVTKQLMDNSQAGGYSAITAQFHVDYFQYGEIQPWAEQTLSYAQTLGIPMWTAERWLNYTTGRAATTMTGFSWADAARQLSFTVVVPANSEPQSVALPTANNGFAISAVHVDNAPASVATQPITARDTSFVTIPPGTHFVVATYGTAIPLPEHPPIANADTANVMEAQSVVIPVLANDSDADGDPLTVVSTTPDSGAVISITNGQTISYAPNAGTCGLDTFSYDISDGRGGTASANVTVNVTCVNGQVSQFTFADFAASCALPTSTIVTRLGDGEVRLAGTQGDEYSQPTLDAVKWVAGAFGGGAYTPSLTGGLLSVVGGNSGGNYVRSVSSLPITTLEASVRFSTLSFEHVGWAGLNFAGGYAIFSTFNTTTNLFARTSADGDVSTESRVDLGPIPSGFHTYRIERQVLSQTSNVVTYYVDGVQRAQHTVGALVPMYVYQSHSGGTAQTLDVDRIWAYPPYTAAGSYQSCTMDIGHTLSTWTTADWSAATPSATTLRVRTRTSTDGTTWSGWSAPLTGSGQDITSPAGRYLQYLAEFATTDPSQSAVLDSVTMRFADSTIPRNHAPIAVGDTASTSEDAAVTVAVMSNDSDPDNDPISLVSATQGAKGVVTINANQTITYTPNTATCGNDAFTYTISDGHGKSGSATVSVNVTCLTGQVTHTTLADFGPSCSVSSNTIVSGVGDGDVRLAGVQGDEFVASTLDPALWVAGTWTGGPYAPAPSGGVLSIANANGAYVRSASTMTVTTLEASARFTGLPSEHVGWASLDFSGGYAIFSTYNTTTNLFARTNSGSGEQRLDLGPIPSGFHVYRIDRQSTTGSDTVRYFIDGVLVAQQAVSTLPAMHVYISHNGGAAQTLDVERIWVYPSYRDAGTFQSCTMDGGSSPFTWTTASWNASVPAGTALQLRTRTSSDGATWSGWSNPNLSSGQAITSPAGRYLQYSLELATTDPQASPIVDSVTMHSRLIVDVPTLSIDNVTVTEGNSGTATATFTVSLSAASGQAVTVNYATADGTAAAGSDYVARSGTLTFTAGTTTQTIPVTVNGDTLSEATETFAVNLSSATNATIATAQGLGTITNDDGVPTLSIANVTVTEGNSGTATATFTVSLSAASGQAVTVNYATADGTAAAGSDYVARSGTLTFAAGATTQTIPVTVNGDTLSEATETFAVNLSGATNATIATAQGLGTITNDDGVPTLSIANATVTEGNSGTTTATFTVSLSAASGQAVTVNYATADGTATAGSDYVARSGTLTFTAGTTTQTIPVTVNGDTLSEATETFAVNLSSATNATIATAQGVGTITNDDAVPALSINDVAVAEKNNGKGTLAFTVSLSSVSGQTVTVNYATANGTATAGSDYTAASGTVTFAAGVTSQSINVSLNSDTTLEPDETFLVNLSNPSNATIDDGQGVGTILNNDPPALAINSVSVTEGNGGTVTATFTATLSQPTTQTVTVNYATANISATAGSDYVTATGSLTFPPGTTTASVPVLVNGDTLAEGNETFAVNLSGASNATITTAQGVGTILNDDVLLPALSINDVTVVEGDSGSATATFTVTLSAASSQAVTVNYATANGTASAGSDYTGASGPLTFDAGVTSQSISISIVGDTILEPNESFLVNLSNPSNATIADAQGVGTILNNDAPVLAINNRSVTEGNSGTVTATFTVTLSQPTTQTVTVDYATADGTATAGSDYVASTGTATLPAGATSATVVVVVNGDTSTEANETFAVNLSAAANATIGTAQGIGTIVNDDSVATPTITVVSPNGGENWTAGTTVTVTWSTTLAASESVVIELSSNGGNTYSTVLAASTPNDGSQSFTVQSGWRTNRARIRVSSVTNSSIRDTSDGNFKIQ